MQHLTISFTVLIRYSFKCTFVFMSDQIFLLSEQNVALVGHMSFQGKKIICSPGSEKIILLLLKFILLNQLMYKCYTLL